MTLHASVFIALAATSLAATLASGSEVTWSASIARADRSAGTADCVHCHTSEPFSDEDPKKAAQDPRAALFEAKIRPIFVDRCEECHAETADGGLRLDSRENLAKGGDSGLAVAPGDPDGSLLIQAVRHTHAKIKMPKRRAKLAQDEIDALVEWVHDGAYWPEAAPSSVKRAAEP